MSNIPLITVEYTKAKTKEEEPLTVLINCHSLNQQHFHRQIIDHYKQFSICLKTVSIFWFNFAKNHWNSFDLEQLEYPQIIIIGKYLQ